MCVDASFGIAVDSHQNKNMMMENVMIYIEMKVEVCHANKANKSGSPSLRG